MANFENVFLVIQLIAALAIVILVLIQRSEGGGLGIGGGSSNGMMTARGAANLLTRVTRWMVIIFIVNSLILGNISANRNKGKTALDIAEKTQTLPEKDSDKQPTLPEKKEN